MADSAFRHYRNTDNLDDIFDYGRIGHARDTALFTDIRRDAFQSHYGHSTGVFGYFRLFGIGNIHNDPAFKHFGVSGFDL
jgi:hypothetical protein